MSKQRFVVTHTEGWDWYVVPVELLEEFQEGFALDGGEPPEGACYIGGSSHDVTFENPVER